jgi:hypothetical protein
MLSPVRQSLLGVPTKGSSRPSARSAVTYVTCAVSACRPSAGPCPRGRDWIRYVSSAVTVGLLAGCRCYTPKVCARGVELRFTLIKRRTTSFARLDALREILGPAWVGALGANMSKTVLLFLSTTPTRTKSSASVEHV